MVGDESLGILFPPISMPNELDATSRSFALYVAFDFFSGIFAVFYREREVM
jgi:hypothetical protein